MTSQGLKGFYLCVSIQHFDSFSRDEQVHFSHHLRVFILALGKKKEKKRNQVCCFLLYVCCSKCKTSTLLRLIIVSLKGIQEHHCVVRNEFTVQLICTNKSADTHIYKSNIPFQYII